MGWRRWAAKMADRDHARPRRVSHRSDPGYAPLRLMHRGRCRRARPGAKAEAPCLRRPRGTCARRASVPCGGAQHHASARLGCRRGKADADDTTLEDLDERVCLHGGKLRIHGSTTAASRARFSPGHSPSTRVATRDVRRAAPYTNLVVATRSSPIRAPASPSPSGSRVSRELHLLPPDGTPHLTPEQTLQKLGGAFRFVQTGRKMIMARSVSSCARADEGQAPSEY
jgi:hypothetical protein